MAREVGQPRRHRTAVHRRQEGAVSSTEAIKWPQAAPAMPQPSTPSHTTTRPKAARASANMPEKRGWPMPSFTSDGRLVSESMNCDSAITASTVWPARANCGFIQ